jgi:hydrogenase expression/formation protein HypC
MCLGIPGQVTEVTDTTWGMAKVDFGGISRDVSLQLVPEAGVGDWVLVHAGFAIQQIDEQEAAETLKLLQEITSDPAYQDMPPGDLAAS